MLRPRWRTVVGLAALWLAGCGTASPSEATAGLAVAGDAAVDGFDGGGSSVDVPAPPADLAPGVDAAPDGLAADAAPDDTATPPLDNAPELPTPDVPSPEDSSDVAVVPPSHARGVVSRADGLRVAGAAVRLDGPTLGASLQAVTDADGRFDFVVPQGSYALRVAHPKYSPRAATIDLPASQDAFVPLVLPELRAAASFDAAMGWKGQGVIFSGGSNWLGSGVIESGGSNWHVAIPPKSLVTAANEVATGAIQVRLSVTVTAIDGAASLPLGGLPPATDGLDLASVIDLEVVAAQAPLQPSAGQPLLVTLAMPGVDAGQSLSVWSLDHQTAAWQSEGTVLAQASPSGAGAQVTVALTHLSTWAVGRATAPPRCVDVTLKAEGGGSPEPGLVRATRGGIRVEAPLSPGGSACLSLPVGGAPYSLAYVRQSGTAVHLAHIAELTVTGAAATCGGADCQQVVATPLPLTCIDVAVHEGSPGAPGGPEPMAGLTVRLSTGESGVTNKSGKVTLAAAPYVPVAVLTPYADPVRVVPQVPTGDDCGAKVFLDLGAGSLTKSNAGVFEMGCKDGSGAECPDDASPAHTVVLSGYGLAHHEVTVGQYRRCMDLGTCTPPAGPPNAACTWPDVFVEPAAGRLSLPITCVTWAQAAGYCASVGRRLCTEAEWEAAVRGPAKRKYPWGFEEPTCARAVYLGEDAGEEKDLGACSSGQPWPVGSRPAGKSIHGAEDLAGNAPEWVSDWYDPAWYGSVAAKLKDTPGPQSGTQRVVRGGGFASDGSSLTAYRRSAAEPGASTVTEDGRVMGLGIRCCSSTK